MNLYILKDGKPVATDNVLLWGELMASTDRHVACDTIKNVQISTVFLGLDHAHGNGPPLIYESMIFGGKLDGETQRYSTKEQALKGHKKMIAQVKGG